MYVIDLIKVPLNRTMRIAHFILTVLVCCVGSSDYLVNVFNTNYYTLHLCVLLMELMLVIGVVLIQTDIHLNF